MIILVIEKIKRLPKQTEETLKNAFSVLLSVEDRREADEYVKWIREKAKKIQSASMYELIRNTYFYAGQYNFDAFINLSINYNRFLLVYGSLFFKITIYYLILRKLNQF